MFHGTSSKNAESVLCTGLPKGQYVTDDFELAASYAMRHNEPAVVIVDGKIAQPDDPAYDDIEFVAADNMKCAQILRPTFSEKPADWYELGKNLERVHPGLFAKENWR